MGSQYMTGSSSRAASEPEPETSVLGAAAGEGREEGCWGGSSCMRWLCGEAFPLESSVR